MMLEQWLQAHALPSPGAVARAPATS
jgi:hypothetical protein